MASTLDNASVEKPNWFLIIVPLWLAVFVVSCQLFVVAPLLPLIQNELLNASTPTDFALGLLGSAYSIALAISTLIVGPVSDRVGRRKVLVVGTALIAVMLFLHSFARHYESLLLVRALSGMACGVYSGSMVAFVGDYFPYNRRGWATGWIMTGVAAGQVIGTPAAILLANTYGFQAPFVAFGGLIAIASVMAWRWFPQPNVEYDTAPLSPTAVLNSYVQLLRNPGPRAGAILYFLLFLSIGLFLFFFPKWLEEDIGISVQQLALLFVVGGIGLTVGTIIGGMLSDRLGRKPILILACLALAVLLPFATLWITGLASATVFITIVLILGAMRTGPIMALLTALTAQAKRGTMMGLAVASGQVGLGVATAVAGWLYQNPGFLYNILSGAVAVLLMAVVVWRMVSEPTES